MGNQCTIEQELCSTMIGTPIKAYLFIIIKKLESYIYIYKTNYTI